MDIGTQFLIVDDTQGVRSYIVEDLIARGFTNVREAVNGVNALEMLSEKCADCVISDVSMPLMDGFELLKALKQDPVLRAVHVVIMSGATNQDMRDKAAFAGAVGCFNKPPNLDRILQVFEQAIEWSLKVKRYQI